MTRYTIHDMMRLTGLSRYQIAHYRLGSPTNPVVLTEGEDYAQIVEHGRYTTYYYPSAVEKIAASRSTRYQRRRHRRREKLSGG